MIRKVLVVNKYHFISGGAESYFFSIMEALRKIGVEPIPFSVNYPRTVSTPYQGYFVEPVLRTGRAKIRDRDPAWKDRIALARNAIYNADAARLLRALIRDHRPDAAYILNINNHLSPSVIDACRQTGVPVVMRMSDFNLVCASSMYFRDGHPCTDCKSGPHHAVMHRCVHGSFSRTAVAVLANAFHRYSGIYRKVAAFVTPTDLMKHELIEMGFSERIIHRINTFVRPVGRSDPDTDRPYILFTGRFADYKGPDDAVRAFAQLRPPGVSFKLVGDEGDADAQRVKEVARRAGAPGIVFLPFERDREKLMQIMQRSLFTVVPSRFYENLPNTVLESFACGRPVVSTRLGSIPEIVRDEENGLLFKSGDIDDLAAKMGRLIDDPGARERMGGNAFRDVLERFSEERHIEELMDVFESVQEKELVA